MGVVVMKEKTISVRLRIVGGAALPGVWGVLAVSWPLAVAVTDDAGIYIDVRGAVLRRLFERLLDPDFRGQRTFWAKVSSAPTSTHWPSPRR